MQSVISPSSLKSSSVTSLDSSSSEFCPWRTMKFAHVEASSPLRWALAALSTAAKKSAAEVATVVATCIFALLETGIMVELEVA